MLASHLEWEWVHRGKTLDAEDFVALACTFSEALLLANSALFSVNECHYVDCWSMFSILFPSISSAVLALEDFSKMKKKGMFYLHSFIMYVAT